MVYRDSFCSKKPLVCDTILLQHTPISETLQPLYREWLDISVNYLVNNSPFIERFLTHPAQTLIFDINFVNTEFYLSYPRSIEFLTLDIFLYKSLYSPYSTLFFSIILQHCVWIFLEFYFFTAPLQVSKSTTCISSSLLPTLLHPKFFVYLLRIFHFIFIYIFLIWFRFHFSFQFYFQ